ncbi:MAG: D-glycerate dehydrogenase [Betaproteobacteria bacterium]
MSKPRIFITQPVAKSAIERLKLVADVQWNTDPLLILSKNALCEAVRKCDILFCLLHDQIGSEVISANPNLRAITSMKLTPSDIDVAQATLRGIPVTVIPPIVTEATADVCWALLLSVARRLVEGDRLVRRGIFPGSQSSYLEGSMVFGKTLGLIGGGGQIGRAVARRASGFGMKVMYWAPRRISEIEEQESKISYVTLEEILRESDFVSLHTPLKPETYHQIGADQIRMMKPTAFLINTARGGLVDEKALAIALLKKEIAGAGLDVFETEPYVTEELISMDNVVLTPHIGSAVRDLRETMAHLVVDNILAILNNKHAPNCWNKEIYAN